MVGLTQSWGRVIMPGGYDRRTKWEQDNSGYGKKKLQ